MELLTVQETAQLLKVSPITVRRYIASGRLAAVKVGRAVRIRREAVEDLMEPVVPRHLRDDVDEDQIPEGKPLTRNSSLFRIIGMFESGPGEPTDVASNKHKYLAEAYADLHDA